VREGKKAGRSAEDIAKNWTMPAAFTGYGEPQAARLLLNVEVIYNEIK
jgi:hypothetical protein